MRSETGTVSEWHRFLQTMADAGALAPSTANSYRSAATKVLEVVDDPEHLDVRELDVEMLLDRFERLRGENYAPDSLSTYKTRFRKSLQYYLTYLDDPDNFKPRGKVTFSHNKKTGEVRAVQRKLPDVAELLKPEVPESSAEGLVAVKPPPDEEIFEYPFRLRSGRTAYLHLPPELHRSDVDRLIRLLESLVPASEEPAPG